MESPIEPTNAEREAALGRIALWLSVEDLQYLAKHCSCDDSTPQDQRDRCARIRFRAAAAMHKADVESPKPID